MPTYVKGDMWSVYGDTDLFLITTNPIINKQGKLVMGRGMAKQMAEKFPGAGEEYARMVRKFHTSNVGNIYCEQVFGKQRVGFFMVKDHWRSDASIPIIMKSTAELMVLASSKTRVDLNFPGIGNGRLDREVLLPLLSYLPSNVHIWEYGDD